SAERAPGGRLAPRPGHPPGLAWRRVARAVTEGDGAARAVHAPPGRGADSHADARACVGLRLRRAVERCRSVRAVPAAQDRPPLRPRGSRNGARGRLQIVDPDRLTAVPVRIRLAVLFAVATAATITVGGVVFVRSLESGLRSSL